MAIESPSNTDFSLLGNQLNKFENCAPGLALLHSQVPISSLASKPTSSEAFYRQHNTTVRLGHSDDRCQQQYEIPDSIQNALGINWESTVRFGVDDFTLDLSWGLILFAKKAAIVMKVERMSVARELHVYDSEPVKNKQEICEGSRTAATNKYEQEESVQKIIPLVNKSDLGVMNQDLGGTHGMSSSSPREQRHSKKTRKLLKQDLTSGDPQSHRERNSDQDSIVLRTDDLQERQQSHQADEQSTRHDCCCQCQSSPASLANHGPCDFSSKASTQTLIRCSEEQLSFGPLCLSHLRYGSREFGPWCSKLNSRRGKPKPDRPKGNLAGLKAVGIEASNRTSSNKVTEGFSKAKAPFNGSVLAFNSGVTTKDRNADVFDRLSGKTLPYVFRHHSDVKSFMSAYRNRCTVGNVGGRFILLGLEVPEPRARVKEDPCIKTDCSLMTSIHPKALPLGCALIDDVTDVSWIAADTFPSQNNDTARSVPNLAPIREKDKKQIGHNESHRRSLSTVPDSQPYSQKTLRLFLSLGHLPTLSKDASDRLTFEAPTPSSGTVGKQSAGVRISAKEDEKQLSEMMSTTRPRPLTQTAVKLKYTKRAASGPGPALASAGSEVSSGQSHVTLHNLHRTKQGSGEKKKGRADLSLDSDVEPVVVVAAPLQPYDASVKNRSAEKDLWYPSILHEEVSEHLVQRQVTFDTRYASFALAQKIYETNKTPSPAADGAVQPGWMKKYQGQQGGGKGSRGVDLPLWGKGAVAREKLLKSSVGPLKSERGFTRLRVMSVNDLPSQLLVSDHRTNSKICATAGAETTTKLAKLPRLSEPWLTPHGAVRACGEVTNGAAAFPLPQNSKKSATVTSFNEGGKALHKDDLRSTQEFIDTAFRTAICEVRPHEVEEAEKV